MPSKPATSLACSFELLEESSLARDPGERYSVAMNYSVAMKLGRAKYKVLFGNVGWKNTLTLYRPWLGPTRQWGDKLLLLDRGFCEAVVAGLELDPLSSALAPGELYSKLEECFEEFGRLVRACGGGPKTPLTGLRDKPTPEMVAAKIAVTKQSFKLEF